MARIGVHGVDEVVWRNGVDQSRYRVSGICKRSSRYGSIKRPGEGAGNRARTAAAVVKRCEKGEFVGPEFMRFAEADEAVERILLFMTTGVYS